MSEAPDSAGWNRTKELEERARLRPAESMALTVARAQSERGDDVPPNTAAVLVMTIDRLTGRHDWTDGAP
jgi:hypothetical protein